MWSLPNNQPMLPTSIETQRPRSTNTVRAAPNHYPQQVLECIEKVWLEIMYAGNRTEGSTERRLKAVAEMGQHQR